MNLAARCREAISQAANIKKDLSSQKRKTAEAVAQTHLLLDQLKRFKQQMLNKSSEASDVTLPTHPLHAATTSSANTSPIKIPMTSLVETDISNEHVINESPSNITTISDRPETPPPTADLDIDEKLPLTPVGNDGSNHKNSKNADDPTLEHPPSSVSEEYNEDTIGSGIIRVAPLECGSVTTDVDVLVETKSTPSLSTIQLATGLVGSALPVSTTPEGVPPTVTELSNNIDDSEHKEDGVIVKDLLVKEAVLDQGKDGNGEVLEYGLVSSDDFETSILDDDKQEEDELNIHVVDSLFSANSNYLNNRAELMPESPPPTTFDDRRREPINDVRTTIVSEAMLKPKKNTVSDLSVFNSAKESKDSWLEDYDEAAETSDTLTSLMDKSPGQKDYFPHTASPKISRHFQLASINDGYDEEFPSDIIQQPILSASRKTKRGTHVDMESLPVILPTRRLDETVSSNLLSSIDAFEASFKTDFPDSFSPKEGSTPATSPSSGNEKTTSKTAIYDPFVTSNSLHVSPDRPTVAVNKNDNAQKKANGWGGGIRDRAVAAFHRSSRRSNSVDPPGDDKTSMPPEKIVSMSLLNSPVVVNETVADPSSSQNLEEVSRPVVLMNDFETKAPSEKIDMTTRWLSEVKLSTEKEQCRTSKAAQNTSDFSGENRLQEVEATSSYVDVIDSKNPLDHTFMRKSDPSAADANRMNTMSANSSANILPLVQLLPVDSTPLEGTSPTIRKFSNLSQSFPLSSSRIRPLNINQFNTDRYSTPVGDRSTPSVEATTDDLEGFDLVRARYEKAAAPRSNSDTKLESSRSISRTRRQGSFRTPAFEAEASEGDVDKESPNSNVRGRATKYSLPQSEHSGGSRGNTSWRASGGSSEDDGDIPMRTSLSPHKARTDELSSSAPIVLSASRSSSDFPNDGLKPIALRAWRQRELSHDRASSQEFGRGRVRAIVFDEETDERAETSRDLGRQRRHINLSGATRQIRQADRGDGASPLRGSNREV